MSTEVAGHTDVTDAGTLLDDRDRRGWPLWRACTSATRVRDIATSVRRIRRQKPTRSRPARVLQLIETRGPGGAERMLMDLSARLAPECHATIGLRSGWLASQAVGSGIPVATLTATDDVGVIAELLEVVRSRQIDLIHAHEFYMSAIGAAISRLTGVPLVTTVHGKSYYPDRRRRRVICRMVAAQAASVVTVSDDLRTFFCRTIGVPADRVRVIHNGIDCDRMHQGERDPDLLEASGIPSGGRLLGAVGNLYEVKGYVHLIRALPTILGRHSTTHLVILGRGPLGDDLRAEARALGVAERVHLLGHRDDVAKWLRAMDVFASSSLSEGLPLSLLEAMAAGKPAVVTHVGGMPEVVRDGHTGFVVPVADPEALAGKISRLFDDAALADDMGLAGQRHVRELFSLDRMVAQYRNVYRMALGDPSAGERFDVWNRRDRSR